MLPTTRYVYLLNNDSKNFCSFSLSMVANPLPSSMQLRHARKNDPTPSVPMVNFLFFTAKSAGSK